jgi:hypothetical protein
MLYTTRPLTLPLTYYWEVWMSHVKTACESYPALEPRLIEEGTRRRGAGVRRRRLKMGVVEIYNVCCFC